MKGSVVQRGKTWTYRFPAPEYDPATGKFPIISKGGFRTKQEAWKACREAMREADRGRTVQSSNRTVRQFFDEWFAAIKPILDETTWQNWHDYASAYVLPRIGEERLQRLSEPQLLKLYGTLLAEGRIKRDRNIAMYEFWAEQVAQGQQPTPREVADAAEATIHAARAAVPRYRAGIVPKAKSQGLAPKSVRNIHVMIHRALVDAVAWKYIVDNPASRVKPPKRQRTRRQVWSADEMQTFLVAVRQDRFAALFLLELTTGIRRGQVCGLRWESINLDTGEVSIHDNRVVVGGQARDKAGGKQNADKTIAIDRTTVNALREWRKLQDQERAFYGDDYHPGNYVFTFKDGRPPHPDTIRKRFDRIAADAGLPRITFHDLRHSYATAALKSGVGPKIVSDRIGHANVGFFMQTYAHVLKNDDREAAEQAASYVLGAAWDEPSEDDQDDDSEA